MFRPDEKCPTTIAAEKAAWEIAKRKGQEEKAFERRKVEALERIAESLESIRGAQWIR